MGHKGMLSLLVENKYLKEQIKRTKAILELRRSYSAVEKYMKKFQIK